MADMYRIVRMYRDRQPSREFVKGMRGLTLKQAQEHCRDPETSSSTCTNAVGVRRAANFGPWFDGYELDSAR